ncbi:MAG: XRE family transcriptional regulator [Elstera sp.]
MENRLRFWRTHRGLTLEQLAEAAETSHQQIMRLERGERRLTLDWMIRLAQPLGIEPRHLLPETSEPLPTRPGTATISPPGKAAPPVAASPRVPRALASGGLASDLIPVRGAARGGLEQEMFWEDGPIDYTARPPCLAQARDAYALYVVGESMMPRFRPGMLLFVNPHRPPRREAGVVVIKRNSVVLIKEYIELKEDRLVLHQHNPDCFLEILRNEITSFHCVVGSEEP